MQILKTNKFKRCVDGTVLKEYLVDACLLYTSDAADE